jgi:hypothetical protein
VTTGQREITRGAIAVALSTGLSQLAGAAQQSTTPSFTGRFWKLLCPSSHGSGG